MIQNTTHQPITKHYLVIQLNLKDVNISLLFLSFFLFLFLSFVLFRATLVAYGGSQARGLIGAVATGLRQSLSNGGSELRLQPTPQLTATPDR